MQIHIGSASHFWYQLTITTWADAAVSHVAYGESVIFAMIPLNVLIFNDERMRQWNGLQLAEVVTCRLFVAKSLPEPMFIINIRVLGRTKLIESWIEIQLFPFNKMHLDMSAK